MNVRPEKSGLPADRRDQRREDVGDERGDERSERGADDDGDGQIDHVAAQDEVAELAHDAVMVRAMPEDSLHCLIEIPKGSRNKYQWDEALGGIKLARFLFSSVVYPTDYGFVPDTRSPKGEALDAMVAVSEPTFPGCVIQVRAVGDPAHGGRARPGRQARLRPVRRPGWSHIEDLDHVPPQMRTEIEHFFSMYKEPEGTRGHGARMGGPRRGASRSCRRRVTASAQRTSPPASVPLLAARGLTKSFGGRRILDGLDLESTGGARIGVLGPNGGGKSTLLRILAGVEHADAGDGHAPPRARARAPAADRRRRRARRRCATVRAARPELAALEAELHAAEQRLADPALAARPRRDDARARPPGAAARALDASRRRPRRGRGARRTCARSGIDDDALDAAHARALRRPAQARRARRLPRPPPRRAAARRARGAPRHGAAASGSSGCSTTSTARS